MTAWTAWPILALALVAVLAVASFIPANPLIAPDREGVLSDG